MFVTISKVAQGVGVLQYWINRRLNRQTKLIEYRDVETGGVVNVDSKSTTSDHQAGKAVS